jgi:hypothetical protein
MKTILIFYIPFIFLACQATSNHEVYSKINSENWKIKKVTTQIHVYKSGLLDTTFQVIKYYVDGQFSTVFNNVIIRKFDSKNNLISEKTFQDLKAKSILSEEKSFDYDEKNNLVLTTSKSGNVIDKIVKTSYNDNNQKLEEVIIRKKFDSKPKDWNLDSLIMHESDKKTPYYDTSIISYQYDLKGKLGKQFYKQSNQEIGETLTTLYSGITKTYTYGINFKNDTVSITNYDKQGNLTAEITRHNYDPFFRDTILYDGNKKVGEIKIDKKNNYKSKETYKYDFNGNEIENISYK